MEAVIDGVSVHRVEHGEGAPLVALHGAGVDVPVLVLLGRHDSVVGHTDGLALLERYPCATVMVVENAGHALMHEQPELLAATVGDRLQRGSG